MPRLPHDISDATLRLILASGIGPATLRKLRSHFGDDVAIVESSVSELCEIDGIVTKSATSLRRAIDHADPDEEREAMSALGATLVLQGDVDYPVLLDAIPDPPHVLWIAGSLNEEDRLSVAIVGSRKCSAYGREQAGRFSSLLAQSGLTIVSGGALGIDGEAHRGALRVKGRTIAVLGSGLGEWYPKQHDKLFQNIIESGGALLSEFPMRTRPKREHFPRRNRVISGLSLGVLVVEAARRSGALITARRAIDDHNREVMALPGRVDSPSSAGCLTAIREGWAALVTNHAEVLEQLDASNQLLRSVVSEGKPTVKTLFDGSLTDAQKAIIDAVTNASDDVLPPDAIAARTGLAMHQILAELTLLEIRGVVRKNHNGVALRTT